MPGSENTTGQNGNTESGGDVNQILAGLSRQFGASQLNVTSQLTGQIEQLRGVSQSQANAVLDNTRALLENTVAQASGGAGSALKTAGGVLSKVFGAGLGLSPLVTGLVKLFGGGKTETPPALPTYVAPRPLAFEGTLMRQADATQWFEPEPTGKGRAQQVVMPQITVQVNAMDSRSFVDHSQDIARAVKAAMLNSHSINDVISEL